MIEAGETEEAEASVAVVPLLLVVVVVVVLVVVLVAMVRVVITSERRSFALLETTALFRFSGWRLRRKRALEEADRKQI